MWSGVERVRLARAAGGWKRVWTGKAKPPEPALPSRRESSTDRRPFAHRRKLHAFQVWRPCRSRRRRHCLGGRTHGRWPGAAEARDVHAPGECRQDCEGHQRCGACRPAIHPAGDAGRRRPDAEPAREAGRLRRQGDAEAQSQGAHGERAGRRPGGRRLQRLPVLGRAGRNSRRALHGGSPEPESRQARGSRQDVSGSRAHRAQGHPGRTAARPTGQGRRSCTRPSSTLASGSASR